MRGRDLNPRPLGYEPNELPDCSTPRHQAHNHPTCYHGPSGDVNVAVGGDPQPTQGLPSVTGLVGEQQEKLARRDQSQLPACDLFYCGWIISQAPGSTAKVRIVTSQPVDIVGKQALAVSGLQCIN